MSGIVVSEVYPRVIVPVPADGEWIDFFVTEGPKKYSLYWRLNDGQREDPDTVEFGFISAHRTHALASLKLRHLAVSLRSRVAPVQS